MTQTQFIDRLKEIGFKKELNSNGYLLTSVTDINNTTIQLCFGIMRPDFICLTSIVRNAKLGINITSINDLRGIDFPDPTVPINRFSEELKYSLNEMFYSVDIMLKDTGAARPIFEPIKAEIHNSELANARTNQHTN